MLNNIEDYLNDNEVKKRIQKIQDKLYDITETPTQTNSNNQTTSNNQTNNTNRNDDKNNGNSSDNLVELAEYDTCELINNNLDTRFHIGLTIYNNIVDIYKNGDLISSCVLTGHPDATIMPFTFLGDGGFEGAIGKFNYYNTTLNTEQIKAIYESDIIASLPRSFFG